MKKETKLARFFTVAMILTNLYLFSILLIEPIWEIIFTVVVLVCILILPSRRKEN